MCYLYSIDQIHNPDKILTSFLTDLTSTHKGPAIGRLREGNGTPLQYSCLENPMDRGAWWAAVHGVRRVGHD